jgi:hypothetical protein
VTKLNISCLIPCLQKSSREFFTWPLFSRAAQIAAARGHRYLAMPCPLKCTKHDRPLVPATKLKGRSPCEPFARPGCNSERPVVGLGSESESPGCAPFLTAILCGKRKVGLIQAFGIGRGAVSYRVSLYASLWRCFQAIDAAPSYRKTPLSEFSISTMMTPA